MRHCEICIITDFGMADSRCSRRIWCSASSKLVQSGVVHPEDISCIWFPCTSEIISASAWHFINEVSLPPATCEMCRRMQFISDIFAPDAKSRRVADKRSTNFMDFGGKERRDEPPPDIKNSTCSLGSICSRYFITARAAAALHLSGIGCAA